MNTRRTFDRKFKVAAVKKARQRGKTAVGVARELEIDPNLLWKWQRAVEEQGEAAFPGKGKGAGLAAQVRKLAAENGRLRVERDILKKVPA